MKKLEKASEEEKARLDSTNPPLPLTDGTTPGPDLPLPPQEPNPDLPLTDGTTPGPYPPLPPQEPNSYLRPGARLNYNADKQFEARKNARIKERQTALPGPPPPQNYWPCTIS